MIRRLFNFAAVLSLVLCVATVGLWIWSYRGDLSCSRRVQGQRCTLRIASGQIAFLAPPAAPGLTASPASMPSLSALVAELRNDQLDWYVHREVAGLFKRDTGRTVIVAAGGRRIRALGTNPAYGSPRFSVTELAGPLLDALESPDAFAAAHIVLADHLKTEDNVVIEDRADKTCLANVDGLRVVLRPTQRYMGNRRPDTLMFHAEAQIQPGQLPAIREQWHRRLSVPIWSTSAAWVVGFTMIAPALFVIGKARQLRRRRANRCPTCGYDLRATPGRCPECGAVPAVK